MAHRNYTSENGNIPSNGDDRKLYTQKNAPFVEHVLNIRTGIAILKSEYGLHIDEWDYIDLAVNALRDIRHFGTEEYIAITTVPKNGIIPIPCNAETVDAVCTSLVARKAFGSRMPYALLDNYGNDVYIAAAKVMDVVRTGYSSLSEVRSRPYSKDFPGMSLLREDGYIDYHLGKGAITVGVSLAGTDIGIAFTGIMVDLEGYPMITRKQANALAAISAKSIAIKAAIRGDKNMASMLEFLITESARLKQGASMAEEINDNEIDELLDAKTTFNRKSINRPSRYER